MQNVILNLKSRDRNAKYDFKFKERSGKYFCDPITSLKRAVW